MKSDEKEMRVWMSLVDSIIFGLGFGIGLSVGACAAYFICVCVLIRALK